MTDIKFNFSSEKQRKLNVGKKIDPAEHNKRKMGRHNRTMKVNMTISQLRSVHLPEGIAMQTYALRDVYGDIIPPSTPEYFMTKPVVITLISSEVHPFPLARYNEYDLDAYVTETFGPYILSENVTKSECPELDEESSLLFRHEGLLQMNEVTGQDSLNKKAFNVRTYEVQERDLDELNDKYQVLGLSLKKDTALLKTEKTINNPQKYVFEFGEW